MPRGRPTSAAREKARDLALDKIEYISGFIGQEGVEPRDQIKAWDSLAKVGIGAAKDVSVENVQHRLSETLAVLRDELDDPTLERVVARLHAIWA